MKSKPQVTKAKMTKMAKVAAMKKIKAAYCRTKQEGRVKTYQITPV